jgi:hypothetical protein
MMSVRIHPCANATAKPPRNAMSSFMNLPTFLPMESWMSTMSPDIPPMTSSVLVCWSKKPTWSKGSTASSTTRGVWPRLRNLEELRAAAWLCLGVLEKRTKGVAPMEEGALAALLVCPKGEVNGVDKEEAAP